MRKEAFRDRLERGAKNVAPLSYLKHCVKCSLHHIIKTNLQLDWPWIAGWAYVGIFAVAVLFQHQDQFWISRQKN